jgi:hypothetical protein
MLWREKGRQEIMKDFVLGAADSHSNIQIKPCIVGNQSPVKIEANQLDTHSQT